MGSKSVSYTQVSLSEYLLSVNEPVLAEMMKVRESIYPIKKTELKVVKETATPTIRENFHQETFEEVFGINPERPCKQRTRKKHNTVRRITKSR